MFVQLTGSLKFDCTVLLTGAVMISVAVVELGCGSIGTGELSSFILKGQECCS